MRVLAGNPYLLVFLVGFLAFSGSMASYSPRLAGIVCGALLMALAVVPWMKTRKP